MTSRRHHRTDGEKTGLRPTHLARASAAVVATALLLGASAPGEGGPGQSKRGPLYAAEARSDDGMVAAGTVEATRAGVEILERGGNAVDAGVAAALALGVSDPGGSGLGGMTYMLVSLADGHAVAIDGSATVPVIADSAVLREIRDSGERFAARAVAVPATLAALSHALEHYGTMGFGEVAGPAIEIAERGYRRNPNSIAWARGYLGEILTSRYLRFLVLDGGDTLGTPGDLVCRPDLGATLRRLAVEGADSFYRGSVARAMVGDLAPLGGFIRPLDLVTVKATEMPPLRSHYRGVEVLSYPWPGGGAEVVETLNILENFPREQIAEDSAERLHVMVEAFRIAHVDFVLSAQETAAQSVGFNDRLTVEHARRRAALIESGQAIPDEVLGPAIDGPRMGEHTTHISVVDRRGNAVSMTQTLCRQYGAKVATPGLGFPYNCCLEFFDFEHPQSPFYLQPRRRYRSNMAPTIVRWDGGLMILGSSGSDRIPPSVAQVVSNVVDRGMGLRDAVVAPRVAWNSAHDPPRICLEIARPITNADADRLQSFGFEHMYRLQYPPTPVSDAAYFGGVNAVLYDAARGIFTGVGDPRRNGFAFGPQAVAENREGP